MSFIFDLVDRKLRQYEENTEIFRITICGSFTPVLFSPIMKLV